MLKLGSVDAVLMFWSGLEHRHYLGRVMFRAYMTCFCQEIVLQKISSNDYLVKLWKNPHIE